MKKRLLKKENIRLLRILYDTRHVTVLTYLYNKMKTTNNLLQQHASQQIMKR